MYSHCCSFCTITHYSNIQYTSYYIYKIKTCKTLVQIRNVFKMTIKLTSQSAKCCTTQIDYGWQKWCLSQAPTMLITFSYISTSGVQCRNIHYSLHLTVVDSYSFPAIRLRIIDISKMICKRVHALFSLFLLIKHVQGNLLTQNWSDWWDSLRGRLDISDNRRSTSR